MKHQSKFLVSFTTSKETQDFESGAAPLYRSVVTSLVMVVQSLRNLKALS